MQTWKMQDYRTIYTVGSPAQSDSSHLQLARLPSRVNFVYRETRALIFSALCSLRWIGAEQSGRSGGKTRSLSSARIYQAHRCSWLRQRRKPDLPAGLVAAYWRPPYRSEIISCSWPTLQK